jgi:hypothetical protein
MATDTTNTYLRSDHGKQLQQFYNSFSDFEDDLSLSGSNGAVLSLPARRSIAHKIGDALN